MLPKFLDAPVGGGLLLVLDCTRFSCLLGSDRRRTASFIFYGCSAMLAAQTWQRRAGRLTLRASDAAAAMASLRLVVSGLPGGSLERFNETDAGHSRDLLRRCYGISFCGPDRAVLPHLACRRLPALAAEHGRPAGLGRLHWSRARGQDNDLPMLVRERQAVAWSVLLSWPWAWLVCGRPLAAVGAIASVIHVFRMLAVP